MTTKIKKKQVKKEVLPTGMGSHETVIEFDEKFKWPGTHYQVTFDGPKFQEWICEVLPMVRHMQPMEEKQAVEHGIKIGEFTFYLRPFPMWYWASLWEGVSCFFGIPDIRNKAKRCSLELYRGKQKAFCAFSTEIAIPVLAKPDKYNKNKLRPWMSLSPNEVLTQRGQIRRTRQNTAMAGLGLGWAARRVLERKQVTHLTVYDKSQELLDYFGEPLKDEFGDRLTLVCADAYEVDWMQYDVALWDIWEDWGGAAWDRKFEKIREDMEVAGKVCVGWGQGVSTT